MVKDLFWRALLHDHAAIHKDHAVSHVARETHLMRHHDHGHSTACKIAHNAQNVADQLGVERAGRLVKQHDVRIHGKRAGDGDALLLAAG